MAWTFVLTDLNGQALGEVTHAHERKVVIPISKPAAAGFKVRENNPQLYNLMTKDCLLKVYESSTLRFHGQITAIEAVTREGGGWDVAVTAADPAFRLAHRLSGKAAAPGAITADKADIAKQLIDTLNSESETGVRTQSVSSGSTGVYTPGPYKITLACINELSDSLDGFDWQILPTDITTPGSGPKLGTFNAAAVIGSLQPDVVFEYGGTRSNVRTATFQKSWGDLANRVFHIPDDGASSPLGVISQTDATSVGARGLYEAIADASNIKDVNLRNQLVFEHVAVRKDPRRVATFTPDFDDPQRSGRVPKFGTDYNVGDTVRLRLTLGGGSLTAFADGYVRIYQMEINIDNNGKATYTPTTVDEGPSGV